MSWLSEGFGLKSALAPANGTLAKSQQLGFREVADRNRPLLDQQRGQMGSELEFANSLQPQRQQAVQSLIHALSQRQDYQGMADRMGAGVLANANRTAANADLVNRSMGLGEGARAGAVNGVNQMASRQMGAVQQRYLDPMMQQRERQQSLLQLLQVLQEAQRVPSMDSYSQLYGMYMGQPRVQVQQSPLAGILGRVAGMAVAGPMGARAGGALGGALTQQQTQQQMPDFNNMGDDFGKMIAGINFRWPR
jgi:hypothetical protein